MYRLARFNRSVTNRLAGPLAGRIPPFALIHHVGRHSGTPYTTPVWIFHDGERWIVALVYGAGADWVRNVQAAGGCDVTYRYKTIRLHPVETLTTDPDALPLPWPVRAALHLLGIRRFLVLQPDTTAPSPFPTSA
jgi:deazaflavin-dependent oxidoreductase (nitroreductase family)